MLAVSAAALIYTSYSIFDSNSKKMQAAMEQASPLSADQMFAIETSVNASKDSLLETGIYIFGAICALSFLLGMRLTRPVREIRKGARAISGGNLDYEFPSYSDRELWDICAAFSDIAKTASRQKKALALNEFFINRLVDPFWIIDQDFVITDVNQAFEGLFGYSRQEVIGNTIFEFMDEEDEKELRKKPLAVEGHTHCRTRDVSIISKSGELAPVRLTWFQAGHEAGEMPGVVCVIKDARNEHSLRRALGEAGLFGRTLMEAIPEPVMVLDHDLNIISANKAAREGSGHELIGGRCSSLFRVMPDSCRVPLPEECPALSVFKSGIPARNIHEINDGRNILYYEMAVYPIHGEAGAVKNVLALVHDISGKKKFENEIALKNRELTALLGISRLLNKTLVWDEIFSFVLDNLIEFTGMDGGCIFTLDDTARELSCRRHKGLSENFATAIGPIRMGDDIPGRVAATGQPFTTSNLAADRRAEKSLLRHTGVMACAAFPIMGKEKVLGVFVVFSLKAHTFSAAEESVLGSIGEMAGMAFENVRLYDKMKLMYQHQKWRKAEEHRELARMASAIAGQTDIQEMLGSALNIMKGAVMADFIWFLELDGEGSLIARAASDPDIPAGFPADAKDGTLMETRALNSREPVIIQDLHELRELNMPQCLKKYGFEAACSVPVLSEGKATAVIGLYFSGYRRPREEDISFLQTTTSILAVAMEQARTFEKMALERGASDIVLESIEDGIIAVNRKGRITLMNSSAGELAGVVSGFGGGKACTDLFKGSAENSMFNSILGSCLDISLSGKQTRHETVLTHAGANIPVLLDSYPVRSENGDIVGVVFVIKDLSGQTGASGEECPQRELEARDLDPMKLLIEIKDEFEGQAGNKGGQIILSGTPSLSLSGDAAKLKEMLRGLVENALSYSDQGCRIEMWADRFNGFVEIGIKDNGWGIPAGELKKIMGSMYRGKTARPADGAGQARINPGLRCSREIARMHKGNLHIDSVPGEGTTIRIHLPASDKVARDK